MRCRGAFQTLSSNVDRQQAGIDSAIDLLNTASSEMESLKAALMDNHRTLLQNQDVLIHDGKIGAGKWEAAAGLPWKCSH